ncbi:NADPH-dependent ferric siderophore reductase/DNA-binding PadR family transcriptional regulator [Robbsia andropogonis]
MKPFLHPFFRAWGPVRARDDFPGGGAGDLRPHGAGLGGRGRRGRTTRLDGADGIERATFSPADMPHGGGHHGHHGHGGRHGPRDDDAWRKDKDAEGRGGRIGRHGEGGRVLGRGELPLVMLALLVDTPRHGYEIIRIIEERTRGGYAPSAGVVYPTLTMLEEQLWIAGLGADETGKRRFLATESGRIHATANDGLIRGAFARLDMVARMRARESLPPRVRQAMETLKQALLAPGARWDDAEADRVAAEIERAALFIVDPGSSPLHSRTASAIGESTTVTTAALDTSTARPAEPVADHPADPAAEAPHVPADRFLPQRVRHTLSRRLLQVKRVTHVTRHLVRITLTGDDLPGFVSASFDDHVKAFFPREGEDTPRMPDLSDLKRRSDDPTQRPIARDYTPRRYDPATNELDIEFVLHHGHDTDDHADTAHVSDEGRAARWAAQAKPGDLLGIAGPRGSFVVPDTFDWYLLAGDETAFPAIGRRIDELPGHCQAFVFVEASTLEDIPQWPARPNVRVVPALRGNAPPGTSDVLLRTVRDTPLPKGVGHGWVAAESGAARAVRHHLIDARGFDKQHVRAASYWRNGASNQHESLDD